MVPEPKWLVRSKGSDFCCLCRKWVDYQHLLSKGHHVRLQNMDFWMNVYTQQGRFKQGDKLPLKL